MGKEKKKKKKIIIKKNYKKKKGYSGWQKVKSDKPLATVEEELEKAIYNSGGILREKKKKKLNKLKKNKKK